MFEFPAGRGEVSTALSFECAADATEGSRVAISALVGETKMRWGRAAVLGLSCLAILGPLFLRAFELLGSSSVEVGLKLGDGIVASMPAALLVGLLFSGDKVMRVWRGLSRDVYTHELTLTAAGDSQGVEIRKAGTILAQRLESWRADAAQEE